MNTWMSTSLLSTVFCATYFLSPHVAQQHPLRLETSPRRHVECALRKSPCYLFIGPARNSVTQQTPMLFRHFRDRTSRVPPPLPIPPPRRLCREREVFNPCRITKTTPKALRHLRLVLAHQSGISSRSPRAMKGTLRAMRRYVVVPISTA